MTIHELSKTDLTMKEMYDLTMTPVAMKLSDAKDSVIDIAYWGIYEDINSDGENQMLLSIVTPEGETYTTNSQTFREAFIRIVELANRSGEPFDRVKVAGGMSKNGREFITAVLV